MSSAKAGRPRLSDRHREQRNDLVRAEIAEAAIAEFTERGYHDASITNIAERLGSGASTIYNYFTSKKEILEHAIEGTLSSIVADLAGITADPPTSGDEFHGMASRFGDVLAGMFTKDARIPRMLLVLSTSNDPELRERWAGLFSITKALVQQFLADGVDAGFLRRDMDTASTAAAIIAIPMGMIACDPSMEPDDQQARMLVRATVTLVTDGIRNVDTVPAAPTAAQK